MVQETTKYDISASSKWLKLDFTRQPTLSCLSHSRPSLHDSLLQRRFRLALLTPLTPHKPEAVSPQAQRVLHQQASELYSGENAISVRCLSHDISLASLFCVAQCISDLSRSARL